MAPTHPSTKLAALALLVLAAQAVSGAGARPEQVVTSLGLRAAAEALAAAEQGSGHQNDAASVNALRAALDLARAGVELYAAASGVGPVQEHGLLLTLAKVVNHDSDTGTKGKGKGNTTGNSKGSGNGNSDVGKGVDGGGGGDKGQTSGNSPSRSLFHAGQQLWQMLQEVR